MSMRPANTLWFELLTTHDDLTDTLEALAHTGSIELELDDHSRIQMDSKNLQQRLQSYTRLQRTYRSIWPDPESGLSPFSGNPAEVIDSVLSMLNKWEKEAQPLIQHLEIINSRIVDTLLLHNFLASNAASGLDFQLLLTAGPMVSIRLFLLPSTSRLENIPQTVLWKEYTAASHKFLLLVGTTDDLDALTMELALKKNTYVHFSPLPERREDAIQVVGEQQATLERQKKQLQNDIDNLAEKYHLAQALGEMLKVDWLLKSVSSLQVSNNFAWITGWTSDRSGDQLRKALALQGCRAILHFPHAPENMQPPLILENPWWAKPFEVFAGLLGTPSRDEADPSSILAVMTPLLFGYMFGDVGQGLVLLTAGLMLKKRWPLLRILIANGTSAILFGFVFGSVFGREDLISPLWLHPVENPLPVLIVPMLVAVLIMLTGLILKALESSWRGDWKHWVHIEAPLIVLYLGMVSFFILPAIFSWLLVTVAVTWFGVGALLLANGKLLSVLTAMGSLIESFLQLLMNTISFVRVGAFALAHAGLSMAFSIMSDNAGSAMVSLFIMLLGNSIVIALEGLVVSIQITRLILFEFFVRFLQANGRAFKPLSGPTTNTVNN